MKRRRKEVRNKERGKRFGSKWKGGKKKEQSCDAKEKQNNDNKEEKVNQVRQQFKSLKERWKEGRNKGRGK